MAAAAAAEEEAAAAATSVDVAPALRWRDTSLRTGAAEEGFRKVSLSGARLKRADDGWMYTTCPSSIVL